MSRDEKERHAEASVTRGTTGGGTPAGGLGTAGLGEDQRGGGLEPGGSTAPDRDPGEDAVDVRGGDSDR